MRVKPTQVTELFANIKKTFVSFFSILMFVALGLGIFVGISWTAPALQNATEGAFCKGAFHNVQIQFPYGLTDDDLEELAAVEGVTGVETARQSYQKLKSGGESYTVKLQTIGEDIDTLVVREGVLPAKKGEIALHSVAARDLGLGVGDTIRFEKDAGSSASAGVGSLGATEGSEATPSEDKDGMQYLTRRTFKVTALVDSPDYLATSKATWGIAPTPSGSVDAVAWVLPAAFDASAFLDAYPLVNVRCEGLDGINSFSSEYKQKSAEVEGRISDLGSKLAPARYESIHGEASKKIEDTETEIAKVEKQLKDGEQAIKDGEAKLKEAEETYRQARAEAEAKLAATYDQLVAGEQAKSEAEETLAYYQGKLNEAQQMIALIDEVEAYAASEIAGAREFQALQQATLDEKKRQYDAGEITKEEYEQAKADYDAALDSYGAEATARLQTLLGDTGVVIPPLDHTNWDLALAVAETALDECENLPVTIEGQTMTIAEARVKVAELEAQINKGEQELQEKSALLADGWAQYYAGQQALEDKTAEYEQLKADGEAKLADVRKQVSEGKEKLADGKEQLAAAKARLAEMKEYGWTVLSRSSNSAASEVSMLSSVTTNLSFSMAALFIIVGLLVSYSAVSRIVHEAITQIGTKKALGLRGKEITRSFVWYSTIAVIAGAVIGGVMGVIAVEGIIGHVLGSMFVFGDYPPHFGLPLFLLVTAVEALLVLGATVLACRGILRRQAVDLLRGETPTAAKARFYEKWAVWERASVLTQTIVNNCVNDKRRVFSTIVGVAGCTALIVTAITLNNDVLHSYDRQYANVYGFNAITYVDSEADGAADGVEETFEGQGLEATQVVRKTLMLKQPDGNAGAVIALVPMDEEGFSRLYHINSTTGGAVDLSQEGAWVSQAYGQHFGAGPGDEIVVDAGDGKEHRIPILGFYEQWLPQNEMVMGAGYYEAEFGAAAPNVVLADTGDAEVEGFKPRLSEVAGFDKIVDDKAEQRKNFDTFSSVSSAVVAIYLALSVLMAVVVLLNLNTMFIEEKKRELIVLRINGFGVKYAKRYVSYDTIVLTAIGIVAGLVLGCFMGSITVAAIEPTSGVFLKEIDPLAVLVGVVGTAVLALVMCLIALRRIPRFNLTDINKL